MKKIFILMLCILSFSLVGCTDMFKPLSPSVSETDSSIEKIESRSNE